MSSHVAKYSRRGKDRDCGIVAQETGKVALDLRKLHYETELKRLGLPDDVEACVNHLIGLRSEGLRFKYEQVFAFTRLKQFGSFWEDFRCTSFDEFLSVFDFPNVQTLASREVMVRTFSQETFLLVGDDILGEMMFLVARHQNDTTRRKTDYQAIFAAYTGKYTSFDKTKFREVLNWYINTTYVVPAEQLRAKSRELYRAPTRQQESGWSSHKVARPIPTTTYTKAESSPLHNAPTRSSVIEHDFVIETRQCPGCKARDEYIERLESVIRVKLGESVLSSLKAKVKLRKAA